MQSVGRQEVPKEGPTIGEKRLRRYEWANAFQEDTSPAFQDFLLKLCKVDTEAIKSAEVGRRQGSRHMQTTTAENRNV